MTPQDFLQSNSNSTGTIDQYIKPLSFITEARMNAERAIENSCGNSVSAIDEYITNVANDSYPQLEIYVQRAGEIPLDDHKAVFVQAAMIRAEQLAYIMQATMCNEEEALFILESEESDAKRQHIPDADYILTPDVQACIKKFLEHTCDLCDKISKTNDPLNLVTTVTFITGFNPNVQVTSWFDLIGNVMQDEPAYNNEYYKDQAEYWKNTYPSVADRFDGQTTGKSVFDVIQNIINKIGAGAQSTASQVATTSLKDAIINNLPLIIIIVLVVAATLYYTVYAAAHRKS